MLHDWASVALLSGVLAAALHAALLCMQRRNGLKKKDRTGEAVMITTHVTSVLQHDPEQERAAEASVQWYPVGCRVFTRSYGIATVLAFQAQTESYEVELDDAKGFSKAILIPGIDIEPIRVQEFYLYPIKSCRGIRLQSVQITEKGVKNDRTWMFADENGNFITQRKYNRLALVTPKLLPDVENPTSIVLTAPGMEDLHVPIIREHQSLDASVRVWSSHVAAIDQGDAAANWINKFLEDDRGQKRFRLYRIKDSFRRPTDPKYAPHSEAVFADAYPYLLALDSSLQQLNSWLDHKISIIRFRPNIVLVGCPPFADETWSCITIGGILFRNVKPCSRCNLPNVDPETGVADPEREPQKTLTRMRNGELLGFTDGKKYNFYFGVNVVAERTGRLEVGASVKVLTMKTEVFA